MPLFKKRYAPRRKLIRRRKMATRTIRYANVFRKQILQPVQHFKRSVYLAGNIVSSVTSDTFGALSFTLSQVPNNVEFTSLYDQYRINGIKWTLIPRGNIADITPTGTAGVFQGQSTGVFTALDYDDATTPTSVNQLMEYQNVKMTRAHQMHSRYFKPRYNLAGVENLGTGLITNIKNTKAGWLDCDKITVPHFGIKYCLQQNVNYALQYDVKVDFYLSFKNVR